MLPGDCIQLSPEFTLRFLRSEQKQQNNSTGIKGRDLRCCRSHHANQESEQGNCFCQGEDHKMGREPAEKGRGIIRLRSQRFCIARNDVLANQKSGSGKGSGHYGEYEVKCGIQRLWLMLLSNNFGKEDVNDCSQQHR